MPRPPVSPLRFFLIWFQLGAQSFGGGTAALAMIRRTAVDEYGWLTEAEFVRDWALVQLAPGINLLGFIILIGRRWGGTRGIVLALGGLLIPSGIVTMLMAALYQRFQTVPLVHAALEGVLPATVGLGLMTAYKMAEPVVREGWREGKVSILLTLVLFAGSAAIAVLWNHLAIAVILCGAGAVFSLYRGLTTRGSHEPEATPE